MIYFDMDGVLAKFMFGMSEEDLHKRNYFSTLPVNKNMLQAARALPEAGIISAVFEDEPYCKIGKEKWLKKHFPECKKENQYFPVCGERKSIYLKSPDDILVDDRRINCLEWVASGGKAIKVCLDEEDYINEKYPYKVHLNQGPDEILEEILRFWDE